MRNTEYSEIRASFARTFSANNWYSHFPGHLLTSLADLQSFLRQVPDTLPLGQRRIVEEMMVVGMFSSSFFTVAVQRQRRGPPLDDVPEPSGIVLVPQISGPPLPTLLSQRFLLLFSLDVLHVLSAPALRAGPLPQHIFWPSWPRSAHRRSQKCYQVRTWW